MKLTLLILCLLMGGISFSYAQVTAGVYSNGILSQIGIGSDPEKKFFGEGRILAGDIYNRYLAVEAIGQYNFIQSDWHNVSGGLMLGYDEYMDRARIGLPVLLAIKPIEAHRNLALVLEASPIYNGDIALRGNMGIRYTIGN